MKKFIHYCEPLGDVYDNTFVQLFMPFWNFEYTKAVIYTVENVGGGIGQDLATEVTHLMLNQPPVCPVTSVSACCRTNQIAQVE